MAGGLPKKELFDFDITQAANEVKTLSDNVNKLLEALSKGVKFDGMKDFPKVIKEQAESTVKLNSFQKDYLSILKQIEAAIIRNHNIRKGATIELERERIEKKKLTDQIKEEITGTNAAREAKKKETQATKEKAAEEKKLLELNAQTLKIRDSINKQKLSEQSKKETQAKKELATEEKKEIANKRLLIAAQQAEKGSKQQLQAVNAILTNRMKQLNVLIPEQAKKYEQLNAAINRNKQKIADMPSATKRLGGAFGTLAKSIISAAAAYLGFQQAISLVKNVFTTTRNLDALDFSMKKVITDQREFAQTQEFLSKITDSYGAELIATTERYIKFRAAAQQSNLTAKDTQQIFGSMTKIAGTLGLRTDELTGVYLALEQMLSKGKVTTEELRRQLGERIPGAFGIMAKAVQVLNPEIEVTISSLDKMLKSGSVISAEVLPEFARQAEKAFGVENVTRVNTLAAAQNRYKIAWQETVKAMQASDFFLTILEKATNILKGIRDGFSGINEELIRGKSESEIYANNLIALSERAGDQARYKAIKEGLNSEGVALKQNQAIVESLTQSIDKQKQSAVSLADQLKNKDPEAYAVLSNSINNYRGQLSKQFKLVNDFVNESTVANYDQRKQSALSIKDLILQSNAIEILKGKVIELNQAKKEDKKVIESDSEYKKRLRLAKESADKQLEQFKQSKQIELAENAKYLNEIIDNDETLKAALEESKYEHDQTIVDEEIRLQQQLLKITKDGSTEMAALEADIEKLKREKEKNQTDFTISGIKDEIAERKRALREQQKLEEENSHILLENTKADIDEMQLFEYLASNDKIKNAKGNADKIAEIQHDLTQKILEEEKSRLQAAIDSGKLIGNEYEWALNRVRDIDKTLVKDRSDYEIYKAQERIEKIREYGSGVNEVLQEGLNFSTNIYNQQAERAQMLYDSELAAAGESLDAQITAKRKFEAEDKKIKQRQAIANKLQAVFDAGLNLALAIATSWKNPFLATLNIAAASLGLATALATPIPAFAEGVENAPGTFIAGEEGSELIQTKSGKSILTPNKATLFSDDILKGSRIIPADRTAEMLSNMAINQFGSIVDMSESNKHLSTIAKNTGNNNPQPFYDNKGRMHVKKGSTTYIYSKR
jgi:tape measure domain-containing protein